jgi:PAS domain S-box-containing protein
MIVIWLMRDLRRRNATLKVSERHWREIFDQNPAMYFLVDADRTIVSANALAVSQLGCGAGGLAGRALLDLSVPEDRGLVEQELGLCVEAPRQSRVWEARLMRDDGTTIWARQNARFAPWDANRPVFLVSCEDVTESRRARIEAEEKIRRSEATLHQPVLGLAGACPHLRA